MHFTIAGECAIMIGIKGGDNMAKIIAVANQKGGVGKSTTVVSLSAYLGMRGKRVLCIDTDAQGNTTTGFSVSKKICLAPATMC